MVTNRSLVLCLLVGLSLGISLRATEQGNGPVHCIPEDIGDGACDPVCNTKEYNFDGGDCIVCDYGYTKVGAKCEKLCLPEQISDGVCDPECLYDEFEFDGLDCMTVGMDMQTPICSPEDIGDGACDPWCNTEEYDFDDGDCMTSQISPAGFGILGRRKGV